MSKQRFSRVTVTPDLAQRWLKDSNYADNRPISRSWVEYLARQMTKDLWQDNGEPLIFDLEDHLLDGQHRLSAVVLSGKTQTFDVRRGVATEAFTTIDQGKQRTGGQVFRMLGEKNSIEVASICRLVYNWELTGSPFVGRRVSPDELQLVLEIYGDAVREAATIAGRLKSVGKVPVEKSLAGFAYFLFAQISKKKTNEFFDVLIDGVTPFKDHPAITLRNRLFSESVANTRKRLPKKAALGLFFRAWNHHHAGSTVKTLAIKMDGDGSFKLPPLRGGGRGQCNQGGRSSSKGTN